MNRRLSKANSNEFPTISIQESAINSGNPGSFEDAIEAAGFGKFNIALLLIVIPGSLAQIVEQASLSYITPIAQCDLNLSLENKGLLISIGYIGMILGSCLWGTISDTYGRRKIVIYGYLANVVCYFVAAFSQNFTMLLMTKFFSGFIYTGPLVAVASYLSEFHATSTRSRVQIVRGTASAMGMIIVPLIAWIFLPHIYEVSITKYMRFHSWNFFLMICSIPAFITAITFIFLPESPRFLMTAGKNKEALIVFKTVYKINTGRRVSHFPFKSLVEEKNQNYHATTSTSLKHKILEGYLSVKPLFSKPYLSKLLVINSYIILPTVSAFSIKMWYPQILQSINDIEKEHGSSEVHICNIINAMSDQNTSSDAICSVNLENSSVYINAALQGSVQLVAYILAGLIVHRIGKKTLMICLSVAAATCPVLIYFITNATVMLVLFPIIMACTDICGNLIVTVTMEVFPTTFRTTAVNMLLMAGRISAFIGNVTIPYLFVAGCVPTLFCLFLTIFVSIGLIYLLPSTENKPLE